MLSLSYRTPYLGYRTPSSPAPQKNFNHTFKGIKKEEYSNPVPQAFTPAHVLKVLF